MIDPNREPIPPADPVFESGRQDALTKIEKVIERQIKFMSKLLDEDEGLTISKDHINGFIEACKHLKSHIQFEKDFERDKNILASI